MVNDWRGVFRNGQRKKKKNGYFLWCSLSWGVFAVEFRLGHVRLRSLLFWGKQKERKRKERAEGGVFALQQENHFARSCAFLLSLGLSLFTLNYCFCNGWGGIRYHHCTILLEGKIRLEWNMDNSFAWARCLHCFSSWLYFMSWTYPPIVAVYWYPNVNTNSTTYSLNIRGIPNPPQPPERAIVYVTAQCAMLLFIRQVGVGAVFC